MANKPAIFQQFPKTIVKEPVFLWGVINVGATGAPTLEKWVPAVGGGGAYSAAATSGTDYGWQGILSISRTSTGLYVLTLKQSFQRLLSFRATFLSATGAAAAPIVGVLSGTSDTNVGSNTTPKVSFLCQSAAGVAADPASGEQMIVELVLQNSTSV